MGINKVILVGNVGRDPEFRSLPSGTNLAKFSLATTEPRFKDQSGEPHTEWHNIVAWGRQAEIIQQYVSKGRQLYIEGRIRTRSYEKNGQKMWYTEVHVDNFELLGGRQGGGESGPPGDSYGGGGPDVGPAQGFPDEDDVPF
jgi:single-strand DNA-binding protein